MTHDSGHLERPGPIAWMTRHSVAANLLMIVFLVGGFLSMRPIKQEVFPDTALDTVSVTVAYPGASPEEVEKGILLAVEEAVRNLEGVREIVSAGREGGGSVTVEILLGSDVQQVAMDIKSEVDRIRTFPEEAEEPRVSIDVRRREVLAVVVYGDFPDTVLHNTAEALRDWLLQSPDITQVDISGLPDPEIGIEVSLDTLRRYGLTHSDIAARLRDAALDVPGGGLRTESGEVLLRLTERRYFGSEFERLPVISTPEGAKVLLGDIAEIDDSFAETDRYSRFNGKKAVSLEVYRVGSETPIQVAAAVRERLDAYEHLPPGIQIDFSRDRSITYRQRVQLLLKNGAIGLILVFGLLGLFLEARLAFWVMMGLPISFIGVFLFLPFAGVTINMMSLFAFIIALGIVVDDAVVVGENVYHYHQEGEEFLTAAIKGAREVSVPVTFSILTNIAAFLPIYFIPGTTGKMFQMIPVVVCLVFVISLVESLVILPAHLGHQRERPRRGLRGWLHRRQQAFSKAFLHWVRFRYGPFLGFTLRHRYVTIAIAMALLAVTLSYVLSGRMGFQLFPLVESDFADASAVLPFGAPVERTEAVMSLLEDGARQVIEETGRPELAKAIHSDVGIGGSHMGRVRVELADPDIRKHIMSTEQFVQRWREVVGPVMGVRNLRFASDTGGPGGRGRPITVELSHNDIAVLERSSRELADVLATYPGIEDVDDGFQPGKPQLDFTITPEGESLGLTAREVARQVRGALYGAEVLRQQRGRNEIKVMVRLPLHERATEHTIEELLIRTPRGAYVPFREVAQITRGRAYTTIERRNGRRVVQVSADISPRSRAPEVLADLRDNALPDLLRKYAGLAYSFEGHQAEIRESMDSLRVTFVLALLAIYAMLAIPFRSYIQPFIIMLSIPFGIVGAIFGHLIMGYELCIPSIFGIVALSGVVVNDSLVMVDFANRRRRDGLSVWDAIHSAAIQRFRPILLTTLTTFGGLAPMIFETSRQARFLIPMALSLGYGILVATLIILLIIPAMYLAVDDVRRGFAAARRALFPAPAAKQSPEPAPES